MSELESIERNIRRRIAHLSIELNKIKDLEDSFSLGEKAFYTAKIEQLKEVLGWVQGRITKRGDALELKMADADDFEGGWTLDFELLIAVRRRIAMQDEYDIANLETIESVLCAFFGLELNDHE